MADSDDLNLKLTGAKYVFSMLRGQPFGNIILSAMLGVMSVAGYYLFIKDGVLDRIIGRMDSTVEKIEVRHAEGMKALVDGFKEVRKEDREATKEWQDETRQWMRAQSELLRHRGGAFRLNDEDEGAAATAAVPPRDGGT